MMKSIGRSVVRAAFAFAIAFLFADGAFAVEGYPNKTIRIIIPAAPGGPSDVPARLASRILSAKLGQPVVVENRGGAGGALGARAAANAPADGYTLFLGNTSTLAVLPAVSKSAGYDPVKDFVPIVRIAEGFQILVVPFNAPWKSAQELIQDSKANPGKITYAHSGPGSLPHLAGELFMLRSGARLSGVSYRSGGESVTALLTGTVQATFENIAILRTQISEGKVRALGAQNRARTALLPNMPTMAEAGVPNAEANSFYGLAAPAGTPAAIIKALNEAMNDGLKDEEVQKIITRGGSEVKQNSPVEFARYIHGEYTKWLDVGRAAKIEIK
jgi:tripartite-type tricarboxylate transporter receptor subunit TctC